VGLLACAAWGEPDQVHLVIPANTGTTYSVTATGIRGYVDAIYCDVPAGGTSAVVSVSYQPGLSTMAPINLATNIVSADKVWRPRVDATDISGAALTSDGPEMYPIAGEVITFSASSISPTGLVWRCVIVVDE